MTFRPLFYLALCAELCTACFHGFTPTGSDDDDPAPYDSYDSYDEPRYEPPAQCAPDDDVWQEMRMLHDETELSVHELVKCGGLQTQMARTFLIVLVASNRDLFDEGAYAELVSFASTYGIDLKVPMHEEGDGRWTLPLSSGTSSMFTVTFHEPGGELLTGNPFVMDSYLTGVTATSAYAISEMKQDLMLRNTLTFAWQERAAFAPLLAGGGEIPNPFSVRISFADLAEWLYGIDLAPGEPDYGPLESLMDLELESTIVLDDLKGRTRITYDVEAVRSSLRAIAEGGVAFGVNRIDGERGEYRLQGVATELSYDPSGGLEGRFDYRIRGPRGDLVVTDTYHPSSGLTTRWECPE